MSDSVTETRRKTRRRKAGKTAELANAQFKARLQMRLKDAGSAFDKLQPDDFESWEDADDMIRYFETAEAESLKREDAAPVIKRAKARRRIKVRINKRVINDKARVPGAAVPKSRSSSKKTGRAPRRTSPTMALKVKPGLYLGPPKRYIGLRIITPEIDITDAKFRRQRAGIGKCTGSKLKDVKQAYAFAYMMLECAKLEVRRIKNNPADAKVLWHASMENEQAALSYWFGENYSQKEIISMLHHIDDILTQWSMAFCGGFRNVLPVFIRCKSKNGVGGGPARHLVKNTIELFPRYFDMPPAKRSITMLHEMGHRCKSLLKPRDERHSLCKGGWNKKENMCYRDNSEVQIFDSMFEAGNPRILAEAATKGNSSAKKTLLNNIDNYVCYLWNRYADHQQWTMDLLPPGAKRGKPASSGKSKPIN